MGSLSVKAVVLAQTELEIFLVSRTQFQGRVLTTSTISGFLTPVEFSMTNILFPENALELTRGTSRTIRLVVTDPDLVPEKLADATIYFTVKRFATDTVPVIRKSSALSSEAVIVDVNGGIADIFLVPSDTQTLEIGQYIFDAWVLFSDGRRYQVVYPTVFSVISGVTLVPL